jgi:hypothetical protein
LLAQGQWFSPGTLASSTTKTGRHDIAEILLKVVLNTKNSNSLIAFHLSGFVFNIALRNPFSQNKSIIPGIIYLKIHFILIFIDKFNFHTLL